MGGDTAMAAARIDRKPSIEFEPRTLTMDQIQFAREAALYVMNTRTMEAALSVFTEGLEPVVGVARGNGSAVNWMEMMSEEEQYLENEDEDEDDDVELPGIRDTSIGSFLTN
ncbi:hypothetical protein OIU77_002832 [Salix suchowensis]|uniref:Uncharacterized protein n=1 Tax=Salix suchowensis TaxID=1278906 RepID=A0ABQ9AXJ0_9ROSI|nr:hypothetical protein OIU77_002832 [Salix suchowensis]